MTTSTSNQQMPERPRPQANFQSNDPYEVLGLKRGATPREIKRAYFALVREYPPETEGEAFKVIRAAYEKLRNPETKTKTDLFLFRLPSPWEPRKRRSKLNLDFDEDDVAAHLFQFGDLGRQDFQDDYRPIKI